MCPFRPLLPELPGTVLTATGPGRDCSPFWVTCSTPAGRTAHNSPGGVRKTQSSGGV